ncbi:MAG: cryptochrome/photolyase family protein [Acidimicrobiales bacterium]
METVWVLGDQLHRAVGPLAAAGPDRTRILLVESVAKLRTNTWHRQRAHLVLTAMRRLAAELRADGFEVDHLHSESLAAGLADHRRHHRPTRVVAAGPRLGRRPRLLDRLGVDQLPNEQFLCPEDESARWIAEARTPTAGHGGLLPLATSPPRLPHGRGPAGRRPVELRQ